MAHCYYHALSSVKAWGGVVTDYQPLHDWFDQSKAQIADFRHRALRHHAEGIFMLEAFFGTTITNSDGRIVPVRLIGEQHVREDLGCIPSFADWARTIRAEPWMARAQRLAGLPPTLILVGQVDPMRDEALNCAERLQAAGLTVFLQVFAEVGQWPQALMEPPPASCPCEDALRKFFETTRCRL